MGFTGVLIKGSDPKSLKALNNKLAKMERILFPYSPKKIETDADRILHYFNSGDDNNNPTLSPPKLSPNIDTGAYEYMDDSEDESATEPRDSVDLECPVDMDFTDADCNFDGEYPIYGWEAPVVPVEWFELRMENANWGINNDNLIGKVSGTVNRFEWKDYIAWCVKKGYGTDIFITSNADCEFNGPTGSGAGVYWAEVGSPTSTARSSTRSHQGTYSWYCQTAGAAYRGLCQQVNSIPAAGDIVRVEGEIWVVSGSVRIGMWDATTGWWTGYDTVTETGEWHNVAIHQTTPTTASGMYLWISSNNVASEFYFDDCFAMKLQRRRPTMYIKPIGKNGRYSSTAGSVTLYNAPPDMRTHTVKGSTSKHGKLINVYWNDWSGFGVEKLRNYYIFASAVATADVDDSTLMEAILAGKVGHYTIPGKGLGISYDIRVVPYDLYGEGFPSL